jgi:hypothetical protein
MKTIKLDSDPVTKVALFTAAAFLVCGFFVSSAFATGSPTLTSTSITSDDTTLTGATLHTYDSGSCTGGSGNVPPACHTLNVNASVDNGPLSPEFDGFVLTADAAQQATLTAYFAAKGWPGSYITQINSEISGSAPFFYFVSDGNGTYNLADGFTYGLSGETVNNAPLVIDDNYPAGTYTFTGTINGQFETVSLTVTKPSLTSATITSNNGLSIASIGGLNDASLETINAGSCSGSNNGTAACHILNVDNSNVVVANGPLPAQEYGFTLQADSNQQATLTAYFAAKGWPGSYITQIN